MEQDCGMLDFDFIEWHDEDDPTGNVQHNAAAGLTPEEVEDVLRSPNADPATSDSSGRPAAFGTTRTAKYIIVVYDRSDDGGVVVITPKTAYEVDPPE
jgi:hypothetical protein